MNGKSSCRPTMSIVTRCYKRPKSLKRCIKSIQMQTDPDFEHLMIHDDKGRGLLWANCQIRECSGKLNGQYVYILDDDDFLLCNNFISNFKTLLSNLETLPDVIICKGYIDINLFPVAWKDIPKRKQIGSPNFIVKNEIFDKHADSWNQPNAGDFNFINDVWKNNPDIFWWDRIVFQANPSMRLTEIQKEQYGMP